MAKNWTLGEALTAIKNQDKAAIADFGKRFPLATMALNEAKDAETLINAIPERVTMRKIEAALKEGVDAYEEADDIDDVEEDEADMKPKKAGRPKKGTKTDEEKKAAAKARREARKAKAKAAAESEDEDEDDEDDYSGMNALELFKLCKKRGISAQPKKPSKYYIDLLNAADDKADEEEDEEDDWEDEEEEAPAPKKKAGRPKKEATPVKASKKASKKDDDDEDEDSDDWDI